MTVEKIMEALPDNYSAVDRELIQRAFLFAEAAHKGQKRASGEPFIVHCLAVATILAELRVAPALVVAGLLHDTVEDTPVTLDEVRSEFGAEVAVLVDGVTKLTNLPMVTRTGAEGQSVEPAYSLIEQPVGEAARKRALAQETLRKTFLAMNDDPRVVLIK